MAAGRLLAEAGEVFQRPAGFLGKQMREAPHQGSGALEKIGENCGEGHGGRNMQGPGRKVKGALLRKCVGATDSTQKGSR
jgi:hypothetical protein